MYNHPATQANVEIGCAARGVTAGGAGGPAAWPAGRLGIGPAERTRKRSSGAVAGACIGREHGGSARAGTWWSRPEGAREALDPVRYLGNRSSGKMGFALAEAARDRGAAVSLISTEPALPARLFGVTVDRVESAQEMLRVRWSGASAAPTFW